MEKKKCKTTLIRTWGLARYALYFFFFFWLNEKSGFSLWTHWPSITLLQWVILCVFLGPCWGYHSNCSPSKSIQGFLLSNHTTQWWYALYFKTYCIISYVTRTLLVMSLPSTKPLQFEKFIREEYLVVYLPASLQWSHKAHCIEQSVYSLAFYLVLLLEG